MAAKVHPYLDQFLHLSFKLLDVLDKILFPGGHQVVLLSSLVQLVGQSLDLRSQLLTVRRVLEWRDKQIVNGRNHQLKDRIHTEEMLYSVHQRSKKSDIYYFQHLIPKVKTQQRRRWSW